MSTTNIAIVWKSEEILKKASQSDDMNSLQETLEDHRRLKSGSNRMKNCNPKEQTSKNVGKTKAHEKRATRKKKKAKN